MSLAVCVLAKNEENRIADCIKPALRHADEVIVVDNGSEDRTIEIAKELGATVLFSDAAFDLARNKYLEYTHSDWILALDCDERMYDADLITIKTITDIDEGTNGFFIPSFQYFGNGQYALFFMSRLFRRQEGMLYDRPIHSRIRSSLQTKNKVFKLLHTPIHHLDGIIDVKRNLDKRQRNISRIDQYLKTSKKLEKTQLGMLNCHLGREYFALGDLKKAEEFFQIAILLDNKGVALISLALLYCIMEKWDEAIDLANRHYEYIDKCDNRDEFLWRREGTYTVFIKAFYAQKKYEKALTYIDDALKTMSLYPHHHINKWWIYKTCSEHYEIDRSILSGFYWENLKLPSSKNTIYEHQNNFIESINFDELKTR